MASQTNPLALKLRSFTTLSDDELAALARLSATSRVLKPGADLIKEGDRPDNVFLLLEGWAFRYKLLPDGQRQIMAYLIPGDLCDIHIFILKEMDHAIGLLSEAGSPRSRRRSCAQPCVTFRRSRKRCSGRR